MDAPGALARTELPRASEASVEVENVSRTFGRKVALQRVSLRILRGEITALLGPNGAGKTTLLRILCGLMDADAGTVRVLGIDAKTSPTELRRRIGFIPSGDRSFYLRISGLENLIFFGRLYGLSRGAARNRALELIREVGLDGAERARVGTYSHGMQKRLSVARALLVDAPVLLIDEATHDLDPEGARDVRDLVERLARRGTAVLWTTQRLDEIRGFADSVTLIDEGKVRFNGTVPELMAHALPQRYLLRVRNGNVSGRNLEIRLQDVLGPTATIAAVAGGDSDDFVLTVGDDSELGDALRALLAADVQIYACREEQSQIEDAFIRLTTGARS